MKLYQKITLSTLGAMFALSALNAETKTADDLIKTMKKEDITYRQLMNGMAMAKNNIDNGIIGMNKMLVDRGIDFIRTHPAPKSNPWLIMAIEDREAFKASLVHFDKKMDEDVEAIEKAVAKKDWSGALEASNGLSNSCISCHIAFKDRVKYVME